MTSQKPLRFCRAIRPFTRQMVETWKPLTNRLFKKAVCTALVGLEQGLAVGNPFAACNSLDFLSSADRNLFEDPFAADDRDDLLALKHQARP